MTIAQDVLNPIGNEYVELFDIDLSSTNLSALGSTILRYTPIRLSTATINFGGAGYDYSPFPLEITGITHNTDAAPARPQLTISNINKYIGGLSFLYGDLVGAKVTYIRTFSNYLNLTSRISLPPIKYVIRQKLSHNKLILVYELGIPLDKEHSFMPKRQMLKRDFPGLGVNKSAR